MTASIDRLFWLYIDPGLAAAHLFDKRGENAGNHLNLLPSAALAMGEDCENIEGEKKSLSGHLEADFLHFSIHNGETTQIFSNSATFCRFEAPFDQIRCEQL